VTVDANAPSRSEIQARANDDGPPASPEHFRAKRLSFAQENALNLNLGLTPTGGEMLRFARAELGPPARAPPRHTSSSSATPGAVFRAPRRAASRV
jgi:hypothetical protein